MFRLVTILTFTLIFSQTSLAEGLTKEKKQVIDEMLEITDALKVDEMMGTAIANNIIAAMSQQKKNLGPKIIAIVRDEVGKIMHDQFIANGFVNEMFYTIYHKYFTTVELKEIVAF